MEGSGRLLLGAHLPHPLIDSRRAAAATVDIAKGAQVLVDGVPIAPGPGSLTVSIWPDALRIVF